MLDDTNQLARILARLSYTHSIYIHKSRCSTGFWTFAQGILPGFYGLTDFMMTRDGFLGAGGLMRYDEVYTHRVTLIVLRTDAITGTRLSLILYGVVSGGDHRRHQYLYRQLHSTIYH